MAFFAAVICYHIFGLVAYAFASAQDLSTGLLLGADMRVVDGIEVLSFDRVRLVWIGASVLSLVFAASIWRSGGRAAPGRAADPVGGSA